MIRYDPVLGGDPQINLDTTSLGQVGADFRDLGVECRFGDLAVVNLHNPVGVALAETDQQFLRLAVPLAADEDPIAVVVGLRAGNNRATLSCEKPPMRSKRGYLFLFHLELRLVARVLILAAAASRSIYIPARCVSPLR